MEIDFILFDLCHHVWSSNARYLTMTRLVRTSLFRWRCVKTILSSAAVSKCSDLQVNFSYWSRMFQFLQKDSSLGWMRATNRNAKRFCFVLRSKAARIKKINKILGGTLGVVVSITILLSSRLSVFDQEFWMRYVWFRMWATSFRSLSTGNRNQIKGKT